MVAWITGELLTSIASRCDATRDNASPWVVEAAAVISAAKGGWCVCARARVCTSFFSRVVGWCRCRALLLLLAQRRLVPLSYSFSSSSLLLARPLIPCAEWRTHAAFGGRWKTPSGRSSELGSNGVIAVKKNARLAVPSADHRSLRQSVHRRAVRRFRSQVRRAAQRARRERLERALHGALVAADRRGARAAARRRRPAAARRARPHRARALPALRPRGRCCVDHIVRPVRGRAGTPFVFVWCLVCSCRAVDATTTAKHAAFVSSYFFPVERRTPRLRRASGM